jgi:GT2 family glycosyltransferase
MNGLLSIIIVNFHSAEYVRDCLKGISEQNADVEVIIVDNASGAHDRDVLEYLQTQYAFLTVMFNGNNEGFSKANNQGFAVSRGEQILFLNPDTFLSPRCLERLIPFLRTATEAGCVTPKLWMDESKIFLLPPSYLPSLWRKMQVRLAFSSGPLFAAYQDRWISKALSFWNSDSTSVLDAISGAFIMTRRDVLNAVGLFDERFPLYFEDSDLCRRIRRAGLKLYYFPHSEAIHYYNQSAKGSPESIHKFMTSEKIYMEKYYGQFLARQLSLLDRLPERRKHYSIRAASFSKPLDTPENGYLLFSPLETIIPCAAHRVTDAQFTFPPDFVAKLAVGMYYVLLTTINGKIYDRFVLEKR